MVLLALDKSPLQYYLYVAMPALFWSSVLSNTTALRHIASALGKSSKLRWDLIGIVLAALAVAEVSVLGFFWREVFSLCFVGLAIWGWNQAALSYSTRFIWALLNLALAIFPVIPTDLGQILPVVYNLKLFFHIILSLIPM